MRWEFGPQLIGIFIGLLISLAAMDTIYPPATAQANQNLQATNTQQIEKR